MKNVTGFLAIAAMLVACQGKSKKKSSSDDSNGEKAKKENVEVTTKSLKGEWLGECDSRNGSDSERAILNIIDDQITLYLVGYTDPNCSELWYTKNAVSSYSVGKSPNGTNIYTIDLEVKSLGYTPHTGR